MMFASALFLSILIQDCKGIVLVNDETELLERGDLSQVEGFYAKGIKIPGEPKLLEKMLEPLYLHEPLDMERIEQIKKTIYFYYHEQNCPLVIATIPEQNITDGVLQLVVAQAKLGTLEVEGNRHTSSTLLETYIDLLPGEVIESDKVAKNLNFINRHPFRRVDLVYKPGQHFRTTDITLVTKDRLSFRFYAGADNTGIDVTGRERYFTGFTWGNAFGLDHILAAQFTSAYNTNEFQAVTAQYTAFLSWRHILNIYGGYSRVHADVPELIMQNDGLSGQASLRYSIPFGIREFLSQEFIFGFDFKRLTNTLEFNVASFNIEQAVNLTQFALTYSGNYEAQRYRLDFSADFFCSPASWIPDQSHADFSSQRSGAIPQWYYVQGELKYLQKLARNFSFYGWVRGQATPYSLLPSEQVGIGGYNTVRGYEERQFNADQAIIANIELRSPPFSIFSKNSRDAFQFLGFFDYGYGADHTQLPGENKVDFLMGIGPGARYTFDPYIAARLDWGFKLHRDNFQGGPSMLHFSVTASF